MTVEENRRQRPHQQRDPSGSFKARRFRNALKQTDADTAQLRCGGAWGTGPPRTGKNVVGVPGKPA